MIFVCMLRGLSQTFKSHALYHNKHLCNTETLILRKDRIVYVTFNKILIYFFTILKQQIIIKFDSNKP